MWSAEGGDVQSLRTVQTEPDAQAVLPDLRLVNICLANRRAMPEQRLDPLTIQYRRTAPRQGTGPTPGQRAVASSKRQGYCKTWVMMPRVK